MTPYKGGMAYFIIYIAPNKKTALKRKKI